jgi:RNA polymerase sigma factor (sigma-70 family)
VNLSDAEIQKLRSRLRAKVRHHLGGFCPDVEDVVQESMTRWIRADQEGKVERPENAGAFLSGVCNRVIWEYRRRVVRDAAPSEELDDRPSPGISQAEDLELRDGIEAVLSQLLDRDCRVLTGIYLDGRTAEEVCRENQIAPEHLKIVLFRAKARFREAYLRQVKLRAVRRHLEADT